MAIEKAKDGWFERFKGCCIYGAHKTVHTVVHPRTGATVEVVYAAHSLLHAESMSATVIYVALLIVAMAHVIWVHLEM